jgi:hypothetical protein
MGVPDILEYLSLTTKLPFDDDEFDHVRMNGLGRGIPENKVSIRHRPGFVAP